MSKLNRAEARKVASTVKEIYKEALETKEGVKEVRVNDQGFVVTSEELFDIIMGLMGISRFASMPIFKAKIEMQKNREALIAYFEQIRISKLEGTE